MTHFYSKSTIIRDNFFKNPKKVVDLSKKQLYKKMPEYPGSRTDNLLESTDPITRNFALFFSKKIADEVFPGIYNFLIDVRFHINDVYDIEEANFGWIHNDESQLAGVVYLNEETLDFNAGTSIFEKVTDNDFEVEDIRSRIDFNLYGKISDKFLLDLENNHSDFEETIKIGNRYNRIIAYDAQEFHRPNTFRLKNQQLRRTIVFFINNYSFKSHDLVTVNNFWNDQ